MSGIDSSSIFIDEASASLSIEHGIFSPLDSKPTRQVMFTGICSQFKSGFTDWKDEFCQAQLVFFVSTEAKNQYFSIMEMDDETFLAAFYGLSDNDFSHLIDTMSAAPMGHWRVVLQYEGHESLWDISKLPQAERMKVEISGYSLTSKTMEAA